MAAAVLAGPGCVSSLAALIPGINRCAAFVNFVNVA